VREYSVPALAEIPADASLADVVFRRASEQPQAVIMRRTAGDGWADVTVQG
jgi:long-chain acyl-CoA synthetase